jgi:hypothetical protein
MLTEVLRESKTHRKPSTGALMIPDLQADFWRDHHANVSETNLDLHFNPSTSCTLPKDVCWQHFENNVEDFVESSSHSWSAEQRDILKNLFNFMGYFFIEQEITDPSSIYIFINFHRLYVRLFFTNPMIISSRSYNSLPTKSWSKTQFYSFFITIHIKI